MSAPNTCPQCRAVLKLPEARGPEQMVTCPRCRLKFVPPPQSSAQSSPPTRSLAPLILILMAFVLAIGGGAAAWQWLSNRNRDNDNAAVVAQSADKKPANAKKTGPEQEPPQVEKSAETKFAAQSANKLTDKGPTPMVTPDKPTPPTATNVEPPDEPRQLTKKPPQKTFVESKSAAEVKQPEPPPPLTAAAKRDHPRQKEINDAIEKGLAYLRKAQRVNGTWSEQGAANNLIQFASNYDVGYAALGGLTLLECGAPADDPAVQKAAAFVRNTAITDRLHQNYQLSCAILFLDKLGDPKDRGLIQAYALTLVAGQNARGGWTYYSPELNHGEKLQLLGFLEATRLPVAELKDSLTNKDKTVLGDPLQGPTEKADPKPAGKGDKPATKKPAAKPKPAMPPITSLARKVASIPIVYHYYYPKAPPIGIGADPSAGGPLTINLDDNSNAQFALLALWAARRHGVPTERCFLSAGQRFATSQSPDGGWTYAVGMLMTKESSPTMTCVGLLGLAMGHAVLPAANQGAKDQLPENPIIAKGLRKLGEHIDAKSMSNFYLLWSIERVAMLYSLPTLGNRDWYDVGVNMLLPRQQDDGRWAVPGGYSGNSPPLDTCFALLFLKRSNLMRDLSERLPFLMAITDPAAPPNR